MTQGIFGRDGISKILIVAAPGAAGSPLGYFLYAEISVKEQLCVCLKDECELSDTGIENSSMTNDSPEAFLQTCFDKMEDDPSTEVMIVVFKTADASLYEEIRKSIKDDVVLISSGWSDRGEYEIDFNGRSFGTDKIVNVLPVLKTNLEKILRLNGITCGKR